MRGRRRCAAPFDPPDEGKVQDWAEPFALLRKHYHFSTGELRDVDEPEMMGYLGHVQAMEKREAEALAFSIAEWLAKMLGK